MEKPRIVSQEEWIAERKALLAREKELTHSRDRVSAERRQLPWVKITKEYVFDTLQGKKTLADLFEGRSQLIVGHFMFSPTGMPAASAARSPTTSRCRLAASEAPRRDLCRGRPRAARQARGLPQAHGLALQFRLVLRQRLQLRFPRLLHQGRPRRRQGLLQLSRRPRRRWRTCPAPASSPRTKNGDIYHTYSQFGRGGEEVLSAYMLLDLTPKGRNETHAMSWVKRHDEYGDGERRIEAA